MALFTLSSPQMVIYLKNQSLEIFQKGGEVVNKLDFPPHTLENQEIINHQELEKTLTDFIKQTHIKSQKSLLILSDDVIFQKTLPISDSENDQFETNKFFEEIPFDPPNIAKKIIKQEGKIYLFAANKNLFYFLKNFFDNHGFSISGIFPLAAFGVDVSQGITVQSFKKISESYNKQEVNNFLYPTDTSTTSNPEKSADVTKTNFRLIIVIIFIIILSFVSLLFLGSTFHLIPKNLFAPKSIPSPTITPTPALKLAASPAALLESTPAATINPVSKDSAKIIVYNGTGTPGQAGRIKDLLINAGFTNVEVGNKETTDTTDTLVQFVSSVPTDIRSEITTELKKIFTNVIEQATSSANFDIAVTTGEQLSLQ